MSRAVLRFSKTVKEKCWDGLWMQVDVSLGQERLGYLFKEHYLGMREGWVLDEVLEARYGYVGLEGHKYLKDAKKALRTCHGKLQGGCENRGLMMAKDISEGERKKIWWIGRSACKEEEKILPFVGRYKKSGNCCIGARLDLSGKGCRKDECYLS